MANELKYTTAAQTTVASSTATIAAAAFNVASDATLILTSTQHSNFPWADVVLTFSGTNSVSSASNYVNLYRRDMNIDGTADAPVPNTLYNSSVPSYYPGTFVGAFQVPAFTSATSFAAVSVPLIDIPITAQCEFHIENKLNVPIGANWVLKVTPKSYVPGA